jgi:hypothetical protein
VADSRERIDRRYVPRWRGAREQFHSGPRQEGQWKSVKVFNEHNMERVEDLPSRVIPKMIRLQIRHIPD